MAVQFNHHTFFVVAPVDLDNRERIISKDDLLRQSKIANISSQDISYFPESSFPLAVVSAICLQPELRPFETSVFEGPWLGNVIPGHSQLQVLKWHRFESTHFICPIVAFDEKPQEQVLSNRLVSTAEEKACSYTELLIPKSCLGVTDHFFLTNGPFTCYYKWPVYVHMNISAWAEIPRCIESYDDDFRFRSENIPNSYENTKVERYVDEMASPFEAAARSAYIERAARLGPGRGSFIPCSLNEGLNVVEPECALEVTSENNGYWEKAVLHILSSASLTASRFGSEVYVNCEIVDQEGNASKIKSTQLGTLRPGGTVSEERRLGRTD